MLKKVAFTMFPVKDTPRARAFYEGTLGLRVGNHSDNGVWTEYDLPGGGCLALFKHPDPKSAVPALLISTSSRPNRSATSLATALRSASLVTSSLTGSVAKPSALSLSAAWRPLVSSREPSNTMKLC